MTGHIEVTILNERDEIVYFTTLTEKEAFEWGHIQTIHSIFYSELNDKKWSINISY